MEFNIDNYYLKSTSFLDFLSIKEQQKVQLKMERREFKKGEFIFRENSISRGVYIVRKGKVKIFQTDGVGKHNIIYFYKKGDFFGHRPILAGEPNPVSAMTVENTVLSFLSKDLFLELLRQSDSLAMELLTNLSREFSVWINMTTLFANYGVKTRVALSLLILSHVYARQEQSKKAIISLNRDDFAAYVGTAKETLVRMLRVFKDEGIITSSRTNIIVLKPRLLMSKLEEI